MLRLVCRAPKKIHSSHYLSVPRLGAMPYMGRLSNSDKTKVRTRSMATGVDALVAAGMVGTNAAIGSVVFSAGLIAFMIHRYKISPPHAYLVRTGLGIKDIQIAKQGFQWPFQTYKYVDMHPTNFTFELQAMSKEKLEFVLPGVFTIGPKDDPEALKKYVKFLDGANEQAGKIDVLIKGMLEGETRTLAGMMTIEDIFNGRKAFKDHLITHVQGELDKFGLEIYNANIKELHDSVGSEYFQFLRQKKKSEAENSAKVDVAEARKIGDIGQKDREAATRQQVAQFEADTVLKENERKQEMEKSKAELAVVEAAARQRTEIARIEAVNAANMRDAELQKAVEQMRVATETERLRASDMSKTQVHAEMHIKKAEGEATALRLKAEAELYAKQQEAKGILAVYEAQSEGLQKLVGSFGGNTPALLQYFMLEKDVYPQLARENAAAIKGLQPKINVWTTGSNADADAYTKVISGLGRTVMPFLDTIQNQTGINFPGFPKDEPTTSDPKIAPHESMNPTTKPATI